jgi:hypothetical protein
MSRRAAVALTFLWMVSAGGEQPLTLVRDGRSTAAIVIAADASAT